MIRRVLDLPPALRRLAAFAAGSEVMERAEAFVALTSTARFR